MKLSSLLEKLEYTCVQGSTEQEVTGVVYDSRKVTDGSLFICIRGAVVDGHKFIPDVTAKGAKVLIVEEEVSAPSDVTVIQVTDTRYAMAFISAAWFGHPADDMRVIGITGNAESWLAKESDALLLAHVDEEGGPLNRAPRNSVLAEMFVLQALSAILQADVAQTPAQYVRRHPGGALGKIRDNER